MISRFRLLLCIAALVCSVSPAADPPHFSGIYPHLCAFNDEGECGTGAVVPWAGKLWRITYAPHKPQGSSDKLYEITPDLQMTVRPESVGGTPANRMIHRESNQLLIGPYVIDKEGVVRVITPQQMFGRLTGNARHLTDPANKVYYATMEEGLYEVDVHSLAVTKLWTDEQQKDGRHADLPGYHGKGLYSGQGRIVYANNGDHAKEALSNPRVPSGALAEWDGKADAWTVVRRNQFTEVTGPGGIDGSEHPDTDPVWSIGWDHRSLILMLLDGGQWHPFRLPKASHCYDGAHGWNTEWPRIRDIGTKDKPDLLMTMHGMFWHFPMTFSAANTAGIRPRSSYLKVIGDFCRWNDQLVFGCDDTAKSEFLNKRKVKGNLEGPGQSQSNLWFTDFTTPDKLGPTDAAGAVWIKDAVKAGDVSDPMLFAGWEQRSAWFVNDGDTVAEFEIEIDAVGDGHWKPLRTVSAAPHWRGWAGFKAEDTGEWVRVKALTDCAAASVQFTFRGDEKRTAEPDAIFAGVSSITDDTRIAGLVRARGDNMRTLAFAAMNISGTAAADIGYYELNVSSDPRSGERTGTKGVERLGITTTSGSDMVTVPSTLPLYIGMNAEGPNLPPGTTIAGILDDTTIRLSKNAIGTGANVEHTLAHLMQLTRVNDFNLINAANPHDYLKQHVAIPKDVVTIDEASVLVVDDRGRRWRLPKSDAAFDAPANAGLLRISREVATERDLFNCHGTFYELPAENADGFAKIRPIASHTLRIMDYASYRGLLILTGLKPDAAGGHIIRSDDGKAALWAGTIDDLWKLGKPGGHGGPWMNSKVEARHPSDPYLMAGFDKKHLTLSHAAAESVTIRVELDITGEGLWIPYRTFEIESGKPLEHEFPSALQARWLRVTTDRACTASAQWPL